MRRTVSLGAQDFSYIREQDCFLVDKTDFIREWWENKDAVTLITRPRRFGKTLNLSMLDCFFLLHMPIEAIYSRDCPSGKGKNIGDCKARIQ